MEEEASSSMISTSFDRRYHPLQANKRSRNDNLGKFKGVVPQQNKHWGAQIYTNHQRIWLGTFKSEKEAAMAYDSAAIKFRSGDSHRNFPWTERNIQEPNFQTQYSTQGILNMIRDGSYQPKFTEFLRTQGTCSINNGELSCMQLFQKELTPSDVGKLNRLVIPKKFAVKYFPYMNGSEDEEDIELVFYDGAIKCWKFRYCYWKSSQSFVFTRGWNRFVKEKNLKEKDIVTFYACVSPVQQTQHFSLIDVTYSNGKTCVNVDGINQIQEMQKELELKLGQSIRTNNLQEEEDDDDIEGQFKESKRFKGLESKTKDKEKGLRLFGVQIN
ncbi:AP2/ERF and B3 domain-containing transcription factor At1g51120 [Euphorbia lathyris]|uniref:AP2/ERF and B3 domain-containing transcription factor At1g51120 n=1 Tax=Euphorbia lathyris TaxID=212925 RepID=UPI003313B6EC